MDTSLEKPVSDLQPKIHLLNTDGSSVETVRNALESVGLSVVDDVEQGVDLLCDLGAAQDEAETSLDVPSFALDPSMANRPAQVVAGVWVKLRHTMSQPLVLNLRKGVLRVDEYAFVVDGESHAMSTLEIRLILYLLEQGGRPVPRDELLVEVWGYRAGVVTRAIDQTVNRIRAKIERERQNPEHLQTVRGQGYRFVVLQDCFQTTTDDPEGSTNALNNLPREMDSFIGRESALSAIQSSLRLSYRLITLHGEPGAGKSRLALEFGRRLIAEPDGFRAVWLVDFSGVHSEEQGYASLCDQIQFADQVRQIPMSLPEMMVSIQRMGQTLILADQCDEALPAVSSVLRELLRCCPDLWVISTSREPLHVRGERLLAVPRMSSEESLALFVARNIQRVGVVDATSELPWLELDGQLEGNPLAIELAARRTLVMSPTDLVRRLTEPMQVLRVIRSNALSPYLSLRSAIESSWRQLSVYEQEALKLAATLAQPFTVQDVELRWVEDAEGSRLEASQFLQSLVRRSLLRLTVVKETGERRLSCSRFVHSFVQEKMTQNWGTSVHKTDRSAPVFERSEAAVL